MDFLTQCLRRQPKPICLSATTSTSSSSETTQAASQFIDTLFAAEKNGPELHQALAEIIQTASLKQHFARVVFETLQKAIETARPMGIALGETYEKVVREIDSIEGFVKEHPVICAVIAIGILVVLAPWVVEALGFAEAGIVEDSFAALWQSRYAGLVPKGSLFSLLQRLGMKGFV